MHYVLTAWQKGNSNKLMRWNRQTKECSWFCVIILEVFHANHHLIKERIPFDFLWIYKYKNNQVTSVANETLPRFFGLTSPVAKKKSAADGQTFYGINLNSIW